MILKQINVNWYLFRTHNITQRIRSSMYKVQKNPHFYKIFKTYVLANFEKLTFHYNFPDTQITLNLARSLIRMTLKIYK